MTQVLYRDFEIIFSPPPIPFRCFDWSYAHLEYDGPEDNRIGHTASLEDAKAEIDFWHAEQFEDQRSRALIDEAMCSRRGA